VTPSEKRSLRIYWYGLTLGRPLTGDVHGHPYHLASNDDGRVIPNVGDCVRSVTPEPSHEAAR
jgi:hypothetical protein